MSHVLFGIILSSVLQPLTLTPQNNLANETHSTDDGVIGISHWLKLTTQTDYSVLLQNAPPPPLSHNFKELLSRWSRRSVVSSSINDTMNIETPTRQPTLVAAEESKYNDVSEETLERVKVIFWFTIFPLFIILGIFGNVLNLITLFSGALKGVAYVYIRWMAVADLSVNLLAIPWALENFVYYAPNSAPGLESRAFVTFLCRIDLVLLNGFMKASVLLVIALTVERYIAVCHPVRYKILCTDSRAKVVVIICYFVAFAISLPLAFQYQVIPKMPATPLIMVSPSNNVSDYTKLLITMPEMESKIEGQGNNYKIYLENPISGHFNIPFEEGLKSVPYTMDAINGSFIRLIENLTPSKTRTDTNGIKQKQYSNAKLKNASKMGGKNESLSPVRYTFDTNLVVSNSVAYKMGYIWFKEIILTFLPIALLVYFNFRIAQDFRKIVQKRRRMMAKEPQGVKPKDLVNMFKEDDRTPLSFFRGWERKKMVRHAATSPTLKNMSTHYDSVHLKPERYDMENLLKSYPKLKETSIVEPKFSSQLDSEVNDLSFYQSSVATAKIIDLPHLRSESNQKNSIRTIDTELPSQKSYAHNQGPSIRDKSSRYKKSFRWSSLKKREIPDSNTVFDDEEMAPKNRQRLKQRQIKNKRKFQNEKRLIALMVAVVVLFLVCILPAAIISIFFRFEKYRNRNSLRIGLIVSDTLEICNYSLNFYLYCFCSSDVRKALWKSLSCHNVLRPTNCFNKFILTLCGKCQPNDISDIGREQSHTMRDGYSEMELPHDYVSSKYKHIFPNGKLSNKASPFEVTSNTLIPKSRLTFKKGTSVDENHDVLYMPQTSLTNKLIHVTFFTKNGSNVNSSIILEHEKDQEYQV